MRAVDAHTWCGVRVQGIPPHMEIPGLRDSLVKILQDYHLQYALRKGCDTILSHDSYNLLYDLKRMQRRGVRVDPTVAKCEMSGRGMMDAAADPRADWVVFQTGSVFLRSVFDTSLGGRERSGTARGGGRRDRAKKRGGRARRTRRGRKGNAGKT